MADKEEIIGRLTSSVQNYKRADAAQAARDALDAGVDPLEAINDGLLRGMTVVGDQFSRHKAFLPQLLTAAAAMYGALDILLPAIPVGEHRETKTVTLAVVEGDVHDIGKNIVKTLLTAGGFEVHDLGKDVSAEDIADTAQSSGSTAIALSALMTTTMFKMKDTIDLLEENGYRDNVKISIGGAPTSPAFAKDIGADHWDRNAQDIVRWLKESA
ncbi:MAG: corrinoid protein [Candidatus Methanomethylophilus sp.]|jgi:corrinoid protein of di/trimethylamine methyltransferase|nr:corrinoid protein [Methanomethylophilus sp.]MCI2075633.1 corrinoid protein [Methanomethylophilus sp.]MCI2092706.1 corrinoid protein [Methanomethylophilus sp.]WII09829.1 corrinoid protein [Methanomassiliicoccales archaeon LGM-DZ1]